MTIAQVPKTKYIIRIVLIFILVSFFGLVVHKYLQFRTVKMEKLRVEQLREEKKREAEARQKAFDEEIHRCDNAKPIAEIAYKNNLLSVNLDCVGTKYVLEEISKKIGVKIVYNDSLSIDIPTSFNNLTIKDGLNIIGKNTGFSVDYIARYLSDKNIWSFDKVILEVKDPPENGVTHIVETKDSFDFIRADGTNKRSYSTSVGRAKSGNNNFILIRDEEFIIMSNQGDIQWKIRDSYDSLGNSKLSNNGKYIVADDVDEECSPSQCEYSSYIISEKGIKKIKYSPTHTINFSQDGTLFIGGPDYPLDHFSDPIDMFSVFDDQGNEIYTKKSLEEINNLVSGFDKLKLESIFNHN